jgi:integrase
MSGSRRRANLEGTYERLESGKWSCFARIGGRKIRGKPAPTRLDAAANLRTRLKELAQEVRDESVQSFTTYAKNWVESRDLSPTTREVYGYWLNTIEADPLGKLPIQKITAKDLEQWKRRQKLANATLINRCRFVNSILKDSGNPARAAAPRKEQHPRRPLGPEERKVLAQKLKGADPRLILFGLLCWHCGLRRSEACGLRHEDVQEDGFWVQRAVLLTKGKLHVVSRGKTSRSHGWVPLPEQLIGVIGKGKGFVLGEGSKPPNPKTLSDSLKKLLVGTALEKVPSMGTHALRRTYGMTLLEVGADVVTAAKAMRHDPKMLLDEYARSRNDLMSDAVKKAFGTPKKRAPKQPKKQVKTA